MKPFLQISLKMLISAGMILRAAAQSQDIPGTGPAPAATSTLRPDGASPDRVAGKDQATAPATEKEFVQRAAVAGMNEVKLAQLAVKKAEGEKVKELAQMLVKDHTAANEQLKEIAKEAHHRIDETPDPGAEDFYNQLSKQTGPGFEIAFINEMERCHQKDIALYEAGRTVSKSQTVTAFIDKTLPVLRAHQEKIKALQPAVREAAPPKPDESADTTVRLEQPQR